MNILINGLEEFDLKKFPRLRDAIKTNKPIIIRGNENVIGKTTLKNAIADFSNNVFEEYECLFIDVQN